MNNELFSGARQAYLSRDYEAALKMFTQCLQENPEALQSGELGLLYHQIGNCLVKLSDYNEAIHSYTQAAADSAYDACGTVNYNLGMAYAALHDYEDAVRHFEIAVSDAKYDTPYKAYTGMGNAYLKLGKSAEAGAAFRSAALDEHNPDPTKALLNLGICFMALDRPQDAVASYESALQFDMPAMTRNKLYANLGQAYVATGQMQNAQSAFEEALRDKTYFLSDSASVDYQRAIAAVSTGTGAIPPVSLSGISSKVEKQPADQATDLSGLDVSADGTPVVDESSQVTTAMDPYYYPDTFTDEAQESYPNNFFEATDEEIDTWSRKTAKQERKRRHTGLKVFLIIFILLALIGGALAFVQIKGFGIPSQSEVIGKLFKDPAAAQAELIAPGVSDQKAKAMVDTVAKGASVAVKGVNNNFLTSEAFVSAKTEQGAIINYKIGLTRDGIGWKVNSVDLYFPSQNQ